MNLIKILQCHVFCIINKKISFSSFMLSNGSMIKEDILYDPKRKNQNKIGFIMET